jgi:sugar phosphate isomerase/epimerase
MLGEQWRGAPDDILDAVAAAGYAGVEFSNAMIGSYGEQPAAFQQALERRGLAYAAFAYATTGFSDPAREAEDLAGAEKALRFAAHFSVPLCLGGPSSPSRDDYEAKFAQACRFYGQVARRAAQEGVTVAVHPHSHHTSLVVTPAEYDRLLAATEPTGMMFNPDTGHLLRGGHEVLACFQKYQRRIVHVHLKDVDAEGHWQPLGQGICDLAALLGWLQRVGYRGWVVAEEESQAAWQDAAQAIAVNRAALRLWGC